VGGTGLAERRSVRRHLWLLPALVGACVAESGIELETTGGTMPALAAAPRVLWIGAHPDDEGYVGPLLEDLCVDRGAACGFVVITDGGKGNCRLDAATCGVNDAGGAPPGSLGALRLIEMQRSAAHFFGGTALLALEDTPSATVVGAAQNWNQRLTGVPNDTSIDRITEVLASVIRTAQPDLILTFDPRHGVYCHPDHRAAGALAVRAAIAAGVDLRRVLMVETTEPYLDTTGQPTARPWVPADPAVVVYDSAAAGTWDGRVAVAAAHASQYAPSVVAALAAFPAPAQRVALLAAADVAAGAAVAPAYAAICASEDAHWSGRGVCARADGSTGPCW
jgi:LmbE family N-acetylglucosaminyl deacetylase